MDNLIQWSLNKIKQAAQNFRPAVKSAYNTYRQASPYIPFTPNIAQPKTNIVQATRQNVIEPIRQRYYQQGLQGKPAPTMVKLQQNLAQVKPRPFQGLTKASSKIQNPYLRIPTQMVGGMAEEMINLPSRLTHYGYSLGSAETPAQYARAGAGITSGVVDIAMMGKSKAAIKGLKALGTAGKIGVASWKGAKIGAPLMALYGMETVSKDASLEGLVRRGATHGAMGAVMGGTLGGIGAFLGLGFKKVGDFVKWAKSGKSPASVKKQSLALLENSSYLELGKKYDDISTQIGVAENRKASPRFITNLENGRKAILKEMKNMVRIVKSGDELQSSTKLVQPKIKVVGGKVKAKMEKVPNIYEKRLKALMETGGTIKTPEELKAKYPEKPLIKVEGSQLKKQIVNAFSRQGEKTFDFEKTKSLDYVLNALGEKRVKQIFKESGMNAGKQGGITKFWKMVRTDLDIKVPDWKLNEKLANIDLYSGKVEPPTIPKAPVSKVATTKLKPEKMLKKAEFEAIGNRGQQIEYVKRLKNTLNDFNQLLGTKLNKAKVTVQDFETGKVSKDIKTVKNVMDKFANAISEVDPTFKRRKNYISHMLSDVDDVNIFREIEEGLWIGSEDLKMGNIEKQRFGKIRPDQLQQDWTKLLSRYSDQVLAKLYVKRLVGDNPFQKTVLNFTEQVNAEVIKKTGKAKGIKIPDFVTTGNKALGTTQKSDYDLSSIGSQFRENNNIMKKIGGQLYDKWATLRDVSTQQITITPNMDPRRAADARMQNAILYKEALQGFVEQAGKTEFTNGRTKEYVNETLAKHISKRQLERNIGAKLSDMVQSMFYRAHLWFSASTGTKQVLESTRLPAYYTPKKIAQGAKPLVSNPIKESKRLTATYKLSDFDDPFDIQQVKRELRASFSKSGINPKRAGNMVTDIVDKIGFGMLTAGERFKNITYASIAEHEGKLKGLKGEQLTKFVREALFEQGNVASRYNKATLFDNSLMRLLFQYSQYNIKNTRQIVDAFQGKETRKVVGLLGSQLLNMGVVMGVTGLAGKYAIQQLVPLGTGPIISFTQRMFDLVNSNYSDETKEQKMKRVATQNIVPGGTQYIRTKEGLGASKGYDESAAGNVRYYGEEVSTPQKVRAGIFGKNALPGVRKYYAEDKRVLGTKQSEYFKEQDRAGQTAYAKEVFDARGENKIISEAKATMNEGGSETVTVGNKKLVKYKDRIYTYDLNDPEDFIDYNEIQLKKSDQDVFVDKNGLVYIKDEDTIDTIDPSFKPKEPELTGNTELDKKMVSEFRGDITKKTNDIYDLYKAGLITAEKANDLIATIKARTDRYATPKKGRAVKKVSIPSIRRAKAPVSMKVKVPRLSKVKTLKAKKYKFKKAKKPEIKVKLPEVPEFG